MNDKKELEEIAAITLPKTPIFNESLALAQRLSRGKVYVIGGVLYKNIVKHLYGKDVIMKDIDLLSAERLDLTQDKDGWNLEFNSYGNPRFKKDKFVLDIVSIDEFEKINPGFVGLESYFRNCPLNVQAIAFDPVEKKLFGQIGINAIMDRRIRVNNMDSLKEYSERKGFSKNSYLISYGKSLGFDIEI